MDTLEAVLANSTSYEEQEEFDPPSSSSQRTKRKRDEEASTNERSQSIHRPTGRSYGDALLLASLSDDQAEERASAAQVIDGGANTQAETPRRSNASGPPQDKSDQQSFVLRPKPSSVQHQEDDTKKVTPDRAAAYSASKPHPYYYYPTYYPPHPYYPYKHPSYPPPPPATQDRESHSPLPYHPLSHKERYEDWYNHYGHAYHPSQINHSAHHAPGPHRNSRLAPNTQGTSPGRNVKPWVSMDENSPRLDSTQGDGSRNYSSPPRSSTAGAPSFVSPLRYDHSHLPHTHHGAPPHTSHGYEHYDYERRACSTPPPPGYDSWNHGMPPHGAPNMAPAHMPHHLGTRAPPGMQPHAPIPLPPTQTPYQSSYTMPTTPISEELKQHQFRKGARDMTSEPVVLRKKFSWRNYPEVRCYIVCFKYVTVIQYCTLISCVAYPF